MRLRHRLAGKMPARKQAVDRMTELTGWQQEGWEGQKRKAGMRAETGSAAIRLGKWDWAKIPRPERRSLFPENPWPKPNISWLTGKKTTPIPKA